MDTPMPEHLNRLPTELKTTVVRVATGLTERKSLVLFNKTWAEIALPFLWETLKTDLVFTSSRDLKAIAGTKSNVTKHVRKIHILVPKLNHHVDHLPALLTAIPRGQLNTFRSDCKLQQSTLNILLRLYPRLEFFKLAEGAELAKAFLSPWTEGCF